MTPMTGTIRQSAPKLVETRAGRFRLTYGVPFEAFSDEVPDLFKGLTLTVSGEAYRQISNITNYTYNNYRLSFGVNRRWEF